MIWNDVIGLVLVYTYVILLLIITEKVLHKYPTASRKVLHIMTGNIAFILPLFQTREVMAFLAAGPFILFTFLMSPHSPIKSIRGKTSAAGHSMGLVYYAITWTILAYVFFDHMEIIAIGIFAMSFGDGFASLLGTTFGKRKYNVVGDEKTYLGSFFMFVFTLIMMTVALIYFGVDVTITKLLVLPFIALIAMLVEAITPKGLDNISVPFTTSILYWVFLVA
jgi:dolichol kinase